MTTENLLTKLSEPFPADVLEWKPGTVKENKCLALAYCDVRAYQNRLDEVCGLDWSVTYTPWGDKLIAHISIGGVTRSSTGEADAQDVKNGMAGTVAESMAFKRACACYGLGRYLYSLPSVWVEFDPQKRRITEQAEKELSARYTAWLERRTPRSNGSK